MLTFVIVLIISAGEVISSQLSNKIVCTDGKEPFVAPTNSAAYEPSLIACALRCQRTNNCTNFNFIAGRCYVNNIFAQNPGIVCAQGLISKERFNCKSDEKFITKAGITGKVLDCICSHTPIDDSLWEDYYEDTPTDAHTDVCIDKCTSPTQCQTYYGTTTTLPCRICKSPPCPITLNTEYAYRVICSVL